MRITNNMKINMSLANIGSHNERLNDLQQQIASGKRILRPSDDPLGAANSIKLTMKQSSVGHYNNNLVYAKTNLTDTDAAFSDVGSMLERFKELSVRAANGTLTQGDRDLIANEMQSLIEQVISDANQKNASGYTFAGSKTALEPFVFSTGAGRSYSLGTSANSVSNINNVVYKGDRAELKMNESENSKVVTNIDGETAFMNVTGQSVYSAKVFADASKAPMADNLKAGYFTIKGLGYEEIVSVDENDSLQAVADKINRGSQIASAKVMDDEGGYRLVIEAREKGVANQFTLIEGAVGIERTKTNFLELAGLNSKIQTTKSVADPDGKIAFQTELAGVQSGYFYLNGRMVEVNINNDSLNDIAKKINDTIKNVHATLEGGKLTLEGAGSLTIEGDSSGLLEKMGIASSRFVSSAMIPDSVVGASPLSKNEWVKNGNFTINGKNIGIIDASTETLYDIAARINGTAGVNAAAAVDAQGRFVISSAQPITFADGTSEFLKSFGFTLSADGKSLVSKETISSPMTKSDIGSIGIAAGTLTINGIAVNYTANDTLGDVAQRVNQSVSSVNAYINSNNMIVFDSASPLDIKDSSNFLEKLAIKEEKIVDINNRTSIKRSSDNAQSIFDILIEIRDQIFNGDVNGLANNESIEGSSVLSLKSGLAKLDDAIAHVADMREITGSALNRVERSTARNTEVELYISKMLTETEGVDFEKAVVELNTVDLIYRSALQISAKVNQQSLLDFLK